MNLNHLYYKQYENISQYKNQPFGSMPRDDNSLRKIRFIQVANVVSPSIFACSSNCWRNSSVSLIWYCGDLFSCLPIDMVRTVNYYLLHGNYHNKKAQKKQTPKSISPLLSVLTNNLTKDKTMANPNNTSYTAQGASKIYLFLGIRRQDLADTGLNLNTFPRSRIAIQADSEQSARAKLAKNWLLLQSWQFKNFVEIDRTFIKGVVYA
ncbi:hypothetical protein P7M47_01865 [Bisgaard Taxon 10/6]|uniref:hypothetical protein n=1 Tax=Exercitatus varius TaxID=67857 RepID=UPI00294B6371|nr:hypothetical protein [Exercitatus varius]MDG2914728.1 hypothetical protein [Exercitatus varius]